MSTITSDLIITLSVMYLFRVIVFFFYYYSETNSGALKIYKEYFHH